MRRLGRLARDPAVRSAVVVTVISLGLFTFLALRAGAADGWRWYRSIEVGERFASPRLLLPGQVPQPGVGYDGQFYFFIAQDPLLRNSAIGPALDNSLRYRRILYPLTAWLLSGGDRRRLPPILIFLNVAACTAAVAACAYAAARRGRAAWPALAVALYPGLWGPLLLDLTEPFQVALAAWGMLADSAGLVLLSCLSKETSAVVAGLELLRHLSRGRFAAAGRQALGLAVLVAWSLVVWRTVPAHESTLGGHLLDPPGAPFLLLVRLAGQPAQLVFLAVAVAMCLLGIARLSWARDRFAVAAAAYFLVGLAAGVDTWADPVAYLRVIALGYVLVFLSWVGARDRAGLVLLALGVFCGSTALAAGLA